MIDDMAQLKQAMEQMDAEDPTVAQAGKDRAAQILSEAKLSFAKMADLIERRRLLLRPAILARIKRMDQPGMLGDAAFRDTSSALRKEGQSFRQIAEAIEVTGTVPPRSEDPVRRLEPPGETAGEPDEPAWLSALVLVAGVVSFPLRHPMRFLAVALLAAILFYGVRGAMNVAQQVSGYFDGVGTLRQRTDSAMSSVSSFVNERILRRSTEASAPQPSPVPSPSAVAASPSAAPATAAAPVAAAPAPPAADSAPPAPSAAAPSAPPTAPAAPSASPSRRGARSAPSRSAQNCGAAPEDNSPWSRRCPSFDSDRRPRAFEDMVPAGIRRNSRLAGPCIGGAGGCYWGGVQH